MTERASFCLACRSAHPPASNAGYDSAWRGAERSALKHCFDTIHYPCLEVTAGKAYGVYVHGNDDTSGAQRSVHTVAGAMGGKHVAPDVCVTGHPTRQDLAACEDLGSLLTFAVTK